MSNYTKYLEAKAAKVDIISDNFDSPLGEWNNYITQIDPSNLLSNPQLTQIQNQKHTDIRSFYDEKKVKNYIVFLNEKAVGGVGGLDGTAVGSIGPFFTLVPSENWSSGTIETESSLNHWRGLLLSCSANSLTTTESLMSDYPINLSDYDNASYATDYLTLSFPKFDPSVSRTQSYVEFTSSDFSDPNEYDSIAFQESNVSLTSNANRDTELRIPLKKLVNCDLSNIRGVRFKIYNNDGSSITFKCLSIRCVSKDWKYAPLDINTQLNAVVYAPSPNGNADPNFVGDYAWPENTNSSNLPTVFPALYKSFDSNDRSKNLPTPINGEIQITFNSGSIVEAISNDQSNEIALYFRDEVRDVEQSDINDVSQEDLEIVDDFAELLQLYGHLIQQDYSIIPGSLAIYSTTLATGISENDDSIQLTDGSLAPDKGFIVIPNGNVDEKISYNAKSDANTLVVGDRGYLSTTAVAHDAGDLVYVFRNLTSVPPKLTADITATDQIISVENTDLFPDSGVIVIGSEYIKYTSTTSNTFVLGEEGERGYWSSQPIVHSAGTRVNYYTQVNRHGLSYYPTQLPPNVINQDSLNQFTQFDLMYYPDDSQTSYVKMAIKWYKSITNKLKFIVSDETGIENHVFNLPDDLIKPNKDYSFIPYIENDTVRLRLYELYNEDVSDPNHMSLLYDTGFVKSNFIKRKKGKFGWSATLLDGDANIQSIQSRGVAYAEIMSSSKFSITPVKGVQAFIEGTEYSELLSEVSTSPFNQPHSTVAIDDKKSGSKNAHQIQNVKGIWQGLSTNEFTIDDYKDINISFRAFKLSDNQKLSALLYNKSKNIMIPVKLPEFNDNQWESIELKIDGESHPSGSYSLIIAEESAKEGSVWWIDYLSIKRYEMLWYGRSYTNGINEIGADQWIPLNNSMNKTDGGTMFISNGKELQIKGLARTQFVNIYGTQFVPNYATLGNFVRRSYD